MVGSSHHERKKDILFLSFWIRSEYDLLLTVGSRLGAKVS